MFRFQVSVLVGLLALTGGCGESDGLSEALSMSIDNFCDTVVMCDSSVTTGECRNTIVASAGGGGTEPCENAIALWVDCLADLECSDLLAELNQFNMCESEFNSAEAICN